MSYIFLCLMVVPMLRQPFRNSISIEKKTYMHFEFIAVSPNLDICIDLL